MRLCGSRRALVSANNKTPIATLVLDFINGIYKANGVNYSSLSAIAGYSFGNSTGGYVQKGSILVNIPPNTPRIGNSGYVSELGGINLLSNSVGLTGTNWIGQNTTVTANNATAPDGTLTASLNTATANSSTGAGNYTSSGITVSAGAQYTASAYFKAGTSSHGVLNVNHGASGGYIAAVFNSTTGVITSVGILAGTMFNSVITRSNTIGNGWFRIEITWTAGVAGAVPYIWGQCNTATPAFQAGGNVSVTAGQTNYAWGGQFENSPIATSYIPTFGSITNIIQQSNYLANSPWAATGGSITVTNNSAVAPDGTLTATLLNLTTTTGGWGQVVTVTANTTYTYSFYAKLGTIPSAKYSVYNVTASSELIVATSYTATTTDWTRVSVTFTTPAGCTSVRCYPLRDPMVTGTLYVWGAQCQLGSVASTYVPVSPAVTNLFWNSALVGSTNWTNNVVSNTVNNAVAPDGTTTATLMTATSTSACATYQNVSVTASQPYTSSFHVKAGTAMFAMLKANQGSGNYATAIFDLTSGTVLFKTSLGAVTALYASIRLDRNGYFRIAITTTWTTAVATTFALEISNGTTTITDLTGNVGCTNGQTLYVWGGQVENSYGVNQFVSTPSGGTGSAVAQTSASSSATGTRAADLLSFGSALGLSFSNVKAVSVQGSFLNYASASYSPMALLNDSTSANAVRIGEYGATGNFGAQITISSVVAKTLNSAGAISTPSTVRKQALSFGNNQTFISQNGAIVNDASNIPNTYSGTPVFNQLVVGAAPFQTPQQMNGYVQKVQLFNNALTQAQLNKLTM